MRTADLITQKLTEAFAPQSLKVLDKSHQHEGHAGHRPGGQTHFRVYIVSELFKSMTRVQRHRLINETLADELAGSVHALAIHAAAPGEGGDHPLMRKRDRSFERLRMLAGRIDAFAGACAAAAGCAAR